MSIICVGSHRGAGARVGQFDRVFRLHRLLAGRKTARSVDDLCAELECSRPTLYRHLAYLRDALGAPLIHDCEQGGYRYGGDGFYELSGLWFSADELVALLVLDGLLERQPFGLLAQTLAPFRARLEKLAQRAGVGLLHWRSRTASACAFRSVSAAASLKRGWPLPN